MRYEKCMAFIELHMTFILLLYNVFLLLLLLFSSSYFDSPEIQNVCALMHTLQIRISRIFVSLLQMSWTFNAANETSITRLVAVEERSVSWNQQRQRKAAMFRTMFLSKRPSNRCAQSYSYMNSTVSTEPKPAILKSENRMDTITTTTTQKTKQKNP